MVNARNKGNSYERKIRQEFIAMGWTQCQTSRYASKEKDDSLVDLVGTEPFNIQLKATERAPSYHSILSAMPQDGNINVLFHKRNRIGEVVVIKKEDFYKLIRHEAEKAQQKNKGKSRKKD